MRVGIITLVGQIVHKYFVLPLVPFWVVVGLDLALGGVWELLGLQFSLQIVLILAGMALLFSARRRQSA